MWEREIWETEELNENIVLAGERDEAMHVEWPVVLERRNEQYLEQLYSML